MRLPFGHEAVVPDAKLLGYLLNPDHPYGEAKARFFARLGFGRQQADQLRGQLLLLAVTTEMTETVFEYGRKYVGIGEIVTPSGERVRLLTVWLLSHGGPPPTFVTAYPA